MSTEQEKLSARIGEAGFMIVASKQDGDYDAVMRWRDVLHGLEALEANINNEEQA